jgi:hypothetical protein
MVTTPDFEWYQLVTIDDTQNNQRGTQTRTHPAQKMEPIIGAGYLIGPVPKIDF